MKTLEDLTLLSDDNVPKYYIGYWSQHWLYIFSEHPYPRARMCGKNDNETIQNFKIFLNKNAITTPFMGYSHCRICSKQNGACEYSFHFKGVNYYVPYGYFHYLENHNVKLDDKVLKIIE